MLFARLFAFASVAVILTASTAVAQPLGTFRWQIQPHCNVLTVNVTQQAAIYTLDGTDDRCGEAQAASVVGIAFLNPSGSVGFGLTVVLPSGTPVHIESTIDMSSLNGTWRDSGGNSGAFIFTPGPGTGGAPRPAVSGGVAANSITAVHIAPAAVGASALAIDAVSGINVIDGSITTADILDAPRADVIGPLADVVLTDTDKLIEQVTINAPTAGRVIASASGYFSFPNAGVVDIGRCSITTGTLLDESSLILVGETDPGALNFVPFGGTRGFTIASGTHIFYLVCDKASGDVILSDSNLTAIFIADS